MPTVKGPSYRLHVWAKIMSAVFNPLVLPVIVFGYASARLEYDTRSLLLVNTIGLVFFVLIPFMILVRLKRNKRVDTMDVGDREARNRPFMYGLLSMAAGLVCFQYLPLQNGLTYIILCMISINNTTVAAIINLKWKISIHALAMSTAATIVFYLSGPIVLSWPPPAPTTVILALILAVFILIVQLSRVTLSMHTPSQVVAGTLLAIILTAVQLTLLVPVSNSLIKV
jgi:membrane-associated phospholipid phosphatase